MAWAIWLSFVTVSAANIVTPGPANMNTLRRALQLGFVPVLPTILGNALGLAIGGVICATGVATFVVGSPTLWLLFHGFGVAYLGWLGLKLIFKRESISFGSGAVGLVPRHVLFKEALVLAATNPKALLFYVALFPQVMNPDKTLWTQSLLLVTTYCALSILSLCTYAATASCIRGSFLTQARYTAFRVLSGLILLGFSVALARST
ncbi:lysine transporter LysE [Tateyamaria omphalii]|uniref:LysE family translocator n=1 Tax=Tateyamaria omphalii TaxID=299262 RepID=UPI00167AE1B2|nr:LysE family translocator [Tateyamaria omphalii]GGX49504.1 lysine transporter LysE [Tateyamaria omphalii]